MPQVPISQEPLQGGALPAFGAPGVVPQQDFTGAQIQGLGQAMTSAGTAGANIADVLQNDLDDARKKEAATLWDEENRNILFDPETGFMNLVGKGATGEARTVAQDKMARSAQQFSKNLDNPVQRGMFQLYVQARTIAIGQEMFRHEAQQTRVFAAGEAKASAETAAGNAVDIATTPIGPIDNPVALAEAMKQRAEAVTAMMETAVREANTLAGILGYGPEQTAALVLDTTSAVHVNIVDRFIKQGNPDFARIYLQQVDPSEIQPQDRTRIQGVLTVATMKDRAANTSKAIITEVDEESLRRIQDAPGTMDPMQALRLDADDRKVEAIRKLRAMDMPEILREATRQHLDRYYADQTSAEAAKITDVFTRSIQALREDKTLAPIDLPAADLWELTQAGRIDNVNTFARTSRRGGNTQEFAKFMSLPPAYVRSLKNKEQLILDFVTQGMTQDEVNAALAYWHSVRNPADEEDRAVTIPKRLQILAKGHGFMDESGNMTSDDELIYDAVILAANQYVREADKKAGYKVYGEALNNALNKAFVDTYVTYNPPGPRGRRRVLARDLTRLEMIGGLVPVAELRRFPASGWSRPTTTITRHPSTRIFNVIDEDDPSATIKVEIPYPVYRAIVDDLKKADTLPTREHIYELWIKNDKPMSLSDLGRGEAWWEAGPERAPWITIPSEVR